jgi:Holliday junction resolvasome RuvABC endonuclease subunit
VRRSNAHSKAQSSICNGFACGKAYPKHASEEAADRFRVKVKKEPKQKAGKATRSIPTGMTRILALDLSLNSTGWATCEIGLDIVKWGALETSPELRKKGNEVQRLDWIARQIRQLLAADTMPTTFVVIENFVKSFQAAELGMLHGVVRHLLFRSGIEVLLVTPAQIKKWVAGKGVAEKSLVIKYIEKRYGYDCDQGRCC